MNEVVRDAVDVPRHTHRINEAKNEHDPERDTREEIEHPEKIGAVENCGQHRNRVPTCVSKNPRISSRRFDDDGV